MTVTFTVPTEPKGLVATICVAVSLTIIPAFEPKSTAVALASAVPVIVTSVPPGGEARCGTDTGDDGQS